MRDVLAVAGVIVVALGLGGVAAYMSVDLSPPGLELIRPPKPAVVAQIKRVEQQRAVQEQASGCKYCADIAELAQTFSRRAETARTHASALKAALPQVSDETALVASRKEELKQAQAAAARAEKAAAVLTNWASRCTAEDFCKLPVTRVAQASCTSADDPRPAATVLIAMAVRKAAQSCASAACPSVDCQASAALRSDLGRIENALDDIGGRMSVAPTQTSMAQLPVGPSTLKAELTRINDEAGYVARMIPLLLDSKKKGQLPKLAPEMIDERAVSAATLATVMEQAAAVSDGKAAADPRTEAAWRLKSLATNMAALGKDAQPGAPLDWEEVADSLGAAFMDLARLKAMLDRVSKAQAAEDCDGSAAAAAQQLREARAMLDLCRMRAACVGRGGAGALVTTAGDGDNIFERAQAAADTLTVDELGGDELVQVADAERSAIDVLRGKGVCRRAGELREAKAAAPVAAVEVAEAAVPPAFTGGGVMSPQDVIAGAVETALNEPAIAEESAPMTSAVVEAVARYSNATPRFKPRRMKPSDPELMQTAAPRPAAAEPDLTPAYQGVVLPEAGAPSPAFGAGGPTRATPPAEGEQE